MAKDQLAALDRAATLRKLISDTAADVSAQNTYWTAGTLADALIATGKLVLIDDRAVEAERNERRVRIQQALLATLDGTYDCTRVWSAWGCSTMDEHDFVPVLDRLEELVNEIDAALFPAAALSAPGVK